MSDTASEQDVSADDWAQALSEQSSSTPVEEPTPEPRQVTASAPIFEQLEGAGGPPQTICDAGSGFDGAWGKDTMLFDGGPSDPIRRVTAAGGVAGAAVTRDSLSVGWPSFLPDGERFLRIQQVEPERAVTHVELVLNWFSELEPLVSGGAR